MPGPTVDPRTVVSGVGGQQLPSSDAPSWVIAVRIASSTVCRSAPPWPSPPAATGQPVYLGRELRPTCSQSSFSAPVAAGGAVVASVFGGRASQMASLTATISSDTSAKR